MFPPWVFKICNVGGDDGATRGSGNDTADSEAGSAVPISIATVAGALAGGEAGPVNAGVREGRAGVVTKLHDREEGELS